MGLTCDWNDRNPLYKLDPPTILQLLERVKNLRPAVGKLSASAIRTFGSQPPRPLLEMPCCRTVSVTFTTDLRKMACFLAIFAFGQI
jgi:hypothetical protein